MICNLIVFVIFYFYCNFHYVHHCHFYFPYFYLIITAMDYLDIAILIFLIIAIDIDIAIAINIVIATFLSVIIMSLALLFRMLFIFLQLLLQSLLLLFFFVFPFLHALPFYHFSPLLSLSLFLIAPIPPSFSSPIFPPQLPPPKCTIYRYVPFTNLFFTFMFSPQISIEQDAIDGFVVNGGKSLVVLVLQ